MKIGCSLQNFLANYDLVDLIISLTGTFSFLDASGNVFVC